MKLILVWVICFFFAFSGDCQNVLNNKKLANKILADSSFTHVEKLAKSLLSKGFNAGDGYPQVWIRDFNTFIETSCKVYSHDVIRKNLLTFFDFQQANGEILDGYVVKNANTDDPRIYLSKTDSIHKGFKNSVETDQETSLIQAIEKYIKRTGDKSILDEKVAGISVQERLKLAVDFLRKERYSEKYGLLIGATTVDWGDVQPEHARGVLIDKDTHWTIDIYDNAMFVIALNTLSNLAFNPAEKKKWTDEKDLISKNIRKYLWDSKNQKFIPHIYLKDSPFPASLDENKIHYHGGTAIAIEAGLLSKDEIATVNRQVVENVRLSGAPSIGLTIYPPYPDGIFKNAILTKPYTYQNGGDWTWFGGRMIQQLIANGFIQEAYNEFRPMVDRVDKSKKFYEWYYVDGTPRGSGSFRGEAGVLARAIEMFKEWAEKNK
jgi:hypothetical protein